MRKIIYNIIKKREIKSLIYSRQKKCLRKTELNKLRENKFDQLIKHVRFNSPYYSELFQNIKLENTNDLTKIPLLTKNIIKSNIELIKSESLEDRKNLKKNSTSGSTGGEARFYSDISDGRGSRAIRGDEFVPGFKFMDKQLIFWGAERDILSKRNLRYFFNRYIVRRIIVSTYHLTDQDIVKYISLINKFKPRTIVGYPSALHFIALEIKNKNIELFHLPNGIISAGEMLQPHQREVIEEIFGIKVFNRYGSREFGHIANECSAHLGLHYNADDLIIEILDDNGKSCEIGAVGNIVVTDLNNYAFPLIRYDIGDLGAISLEEDCKCGCSLPKLKKIAGRSFDVIHGVNGNKVSGTFWTLTFRNKIRGVEAFQIKQNCHYALQINLKTNNYFNDNEKELIRKIVTKKLGKGIIINISINKQEDFEFTKTGKFKWISSALN
jgi:phenylacetate-CoA ligase